MTRIITAIILVILLQTSCLAAFVRPREEKGETQQTSVAFSRDGKFIAGGFMDGTVRVWDTTTGVPVRTLTGHTGAVTSVAFSPSEDLLASGSADGMVRVWSTFNWTSLHTLDHRGSVNSIVFSPDGRTLYCGGAIENGHRALPGEVRVWDTKTWDAKPTIEGTYAINHVSISPDGRLLSLDGCVYDTGTGKPADVTYTDEFSPDGQFLVRAFQAKEGFGFVSLLDSKSGQKLRDFTRSDLTQYETANSAAPRPVRFSPDGKLLAASMDQLTIWNVRTGEVVTRLADTKRVSAITFSPNGRLLAVVSQRSAKWESDRHNSTSLDLFSVSDWQKQRTFTGHYDAVTQAFFTADSRKIVTLGNDKTARLWDVQTGAHKVFPDDAQVYAVALDRQETRLVTARLSEPPPVIRYWNIRTGLLEKEVTLEPPTTAADKGTPHSLSIAPGAELLAISDRNETWLYDILNRSHTLTLSGKYYNAKTAFSSDGKMLVGLDTLSRSKVLIWDIASGRVVRELQDNGSFERIASSHDAGIIAGGIGIIAGGWVGKVVLWSTESGDVLRVIDRNANAIAFSPDDHHIVLSGPYDTRMYDIKTGEVVWQRTWARYDVLSFSKDGSLLLATGHYPVIDILDANTGKERKVLW